MVKPLDPLKISAWSIGGARRGKAERDEKISSAFEILVFSLLV